jgi:hypothetical protein
VNNWVHAWYSYDSWDWLTRFLLMLKGASNLLSIAGYHTSFAGSKGAGPSLGSAQTIGCQRRSTMVPGIARS